MSHPFTPAPGASTSDRCGTSLEEMLDRLPLERRATVERRIRDLIADEEARAATDGTDLSPREAPGV